MLAGCVIFYNGDMCEIPYISLEVLLRSLAAEREALVVRAMRDVVEELSEYRAVPRDELVASVAAVFDAAMLCLESDVPVSEVLWELCGRWGSGLWFGLLKTMNLPCSQSMNSDKSIKETF